MKQHRRPVGELWFWWCGKLLGDGVWRIGWDLRKGGIIPHLMGEYPGGIFQIVQDMWSNYCIEKMKLYKIHPFFHLNFPPCEIATEQVVKWESNVALKERDLLSRLAEKEQQLLGESKAEQQVAASLRLRELALRAGLVASQSFLRMAVGGHEAYHFIQSCTLPARWGRLVGHSEETRSCHSEAREKGGRNGDPVALWRTFKLFPFPPDCMSSESLCFSRSHFLILLSESGKMLIS